MLERRTEEETWLNKQRSYLERDDAWNFHSFFYDLIVVTKEILVP